MKQVLACARRKRCKGYKEKMFSPKRYEVGTTSKALKVKLIGMIGVHA